MPGQSLNLNANTISGPDQPAPGATKITVTIDPDGRVPETNETNNTIQCSFSIAP